MVQWPRRLSAGSIYNHPVSSLDILPTVAVAAGAALPKNRTIDGVDLIPYLTGSNKTPPHEFLFWRWGEAYAIRSGDWKFVKKDDKVELFNLASDIAETQDLTTEHPDLVEHLTKAYEKWNAQMPVPLWPNQIPKPKAEEDYRNVIHQDTGYYIQSGRTYTMTIKAKSLVGTGNRITLYCWYGFWDIRKTLITSADFSLTSSMEAKSISFDSDNYAGRRLIFGYKVTGSASGNKVTVDNVINLSSTDKQP